MARDDLVLFTIYNSPKDYPGKFVVRRWWIGDGPDPQPTGDFVLADSLDEAREFVPPGLVCFMRSETDDPVIVETWL